VINEPSRNEYPEEDIEIVEIDCTPYLTEEQKSWPVVRSASAEEEFAIEEPLPALDVSVNDIPMVVEGMLPALLRSLSNFETRLGGTGFEVSPPVAENGRLRMRLVPRSVEGARERVSRVAQWAAEAWSDSLVTVV
jgi:hypothetical protein